MKPAVANETFEDFSQQRIQSPTGGTDHRQGWVYPPNLDLTGF